MQVLEEGTGELVDVVVLRVTQLVQVLARKKNHRRVLVIHRQLDQLFDVQKAESRFNALDGSFVDPFGFLFSFGLR